MAALSETRLPNLVELRHIRSGDLNPLLEEETRTWEQMLDWDFRPSAGLVRRIVDRQALTGFALLVNGQVVGYSYFVCEEPKGLIGDLDVVEGFASVENEMSLLTAVLDNLLKTPYVARVESQLMMLRSGAHVPYPYRRHMRVHRRNFMDLDLAGLERLPASKANHVIDGWTERKQDEAASLIAGAYQ